MLPELIDNKNKTLKDDLSTEIKSGSKLSIAAACFSIYAFQELKDELSDIDELRFIFTSPTFTTEKAKKNAESSISLVLTENAVFMELNLKLSFVMR